MRLLALLLLLVGGVTSTAAGYEVVVDAGPYSRRSVVVSFDVPDPTVSSWRLMDGTTGVPLQVMGSRASFVVGSLAAFTTKVYTLDAGTGPTGTPVTAVRDGDYVHFARSTRRITRYIGGRGPLPTGVSESYRRAGYIHPVYTPRGRTLTQDMPSDHRHHHGIWFAWTKVTIDGHATDFWNMGQNKGGVQFQSLDQIWSGPATAGLRATHRYIDKVPSPDTTALWEKYLLQVYPGGGSGTTTYSLFDIDVVHDRVGTTPMVLPTYHYGGLGYRAHSEWNTYPSRMRVLTSEGLTRTNGDGTRARWVRVSGTIGGGPACIIIYCHPANFRAPQPLRLNPTDPLFGYAPSKLGTWQINPGEPYLMRYRYALYDETPSTTEVERLWNDYAQPPVVTVR